MGATWEIVGDSPYSRPSQRTRGIIAHEETSQGPEHVYAFLSSVDMEDIPQSVTGPGTEQLSQVLPGSSFIVQSEQQEWETPVATAENTIASLHAEVTRIHEMYKKERLEGQELRERQKNLDARLAALAAREDAVHAREKTVEQRESRMNELEKRLEDRVRNLEVGNTERDDALASVEEHKAVVMNFIHLVRPRKSNGHRPSGLQAPDLTFLAAKRAFMDALSQPLDRPAFSTLEPVRLPSEATVFTVSGPPGEKAKRCMYYPGCIHWCNDGSKTHALLYLPMPPWEFSGVFRAKFIGLGWACDSGESFELLVNEGGKDYYAGNYLVHDLECVHPAESIIPKDLSEDAIMQLVDLQREDAAFKRWFPDGKIKTFCYGLQCRGFDHQVYRSLQTDAGNSAQVTVEVKRKAEDTAPQGGSENKKTRLIAA
ncbi:hypothetical protein FB45DRAFT_906394 [Roridomyces roridus]|uniref:Uncharacterized protein n=1 Tax=Roridomyces roridus TaxID=1738132 RepID=A0AAD7FPT4_9AGAR|nr:hypothetical protein FB45DRAFT_906394 [Roridomyces roridus]